MLSFLDFFIYLFFLCIALRAKKPSPVEVKRPEEGYSEREVTCEIVKVVRDCSL